MKRVAKMVECPDARYRRWRISEIALSALVGWKAKETEPNFDSISFRIA